MLVDQYRIGDYYIDKPQLAHSKLAAAILEDKFGVTDEDILNAIRYHTTGRAGMSLLEKIIFVADATEPNRTYEEAEDLNKLAFSDLDQACLEVLKWTARLELSWTGTPITGADPNTKRPKSGANQALGVLISLTMARVMAIHFGSASVQILFSWITQQQIHSAQVLLPAEQSPLSSENHTGCSRRFPWGCGCRRRDRPSSFSIRQFLPSDLFEFSG